LRPVYCEFYDERSSQGADVCARQCAFGRESRRSAPYEFVLDALAPIEPRTRSMFGCLAVYVGEKSCVYAARQDYRDAGQWGVDRNNGRASCRPADASFRRCDRSSYLGARSVAGRCSPPMRTILRSRRCASAKWCFDATQGSGRCRSRNSEPGDLRRNGPGHLDTHQLCLDAAGDLGLACAGDHVDLAANAELAGEVDAGLNREAGVR